MNTTAENTQTETLHFTVHGDYITTLIRNLMLEDWPHAQRVANQMIGMSGYDIERLLRGKAKLEGVNEFELLDDDDPAFTTELHNRYGAIWKHYGKHYRPYGYVTCFTDKSSRHAVDLVGSAYIGLPACRDDRIRREQDWRRHGVLYFARHKSGDIAAACTQEQVREHGILGILFEMCDAPPYFMHPATDEHTAIERALTLPRVYLSCMQGQNSELMDGDYVLERESKALEKALTPPKPRKKRLTLDEKLQAARGTAPESEPESGLSPVHTMQRAALAAFMVAEKQRDEIDAHPDKLEELRAKIKAQAEELGGFMGLRIGDGWIRVPYTPFLHWALRDMRFAKLLPWDNIMPKGMKMAGDDPMHTDWVVGAGFGLDDAVRFTNNTLNDVSGDLAYTMANSFLHNYTETATFCRSPLMFVRTLCGAGRLSGDIVHAGIDMEYPAGSVLVLPHAGIEYTATVLYAARANSGSLAVIVETGSALAHIVTMAQEKNAGGVGNINIVHLPGAAKLLKEGTRVTVDAMNRCIDVEGALV